MAADNTGKAGMGTAADVHGPRPHQHKVLHSCQQHAEQYLATLFKQVMDKLDDALFERGNKGGPGAEEFIDAARELRLRRQDLSSSFFDKFSEIYQSLLRHATVAASASEAAPDAGGLSLVDEHDLEESLAIDGLVAKANDRFRNELFALAQRYNRLIEGAQYKEDVLPLSPHTIAHAFRDALHGIAWKVEIKLVVFKLFEQVVLRSLGDFYRDTNLLLSKAGILPELKPAVLLRNSGAAAANRAASGHQEGMGPLPREMGGEEWSAGGGIAGPTLASPAGGQGIGNPGESAAASADIFQTLQRLMTARKYGNGPSEGLIGTAGEGGMAVGQVRESNEAALPANELVRGLSLLQHDRLADQDEGAVTVTLIKGALLDQLRHLGDGRGIHPAHDNTIDVIGMIFEFILDEPSIPEVVKDLLNRLQIPILKVAIVDKGFFTNKSHPARRLLNVLGHASIGWNDNSEEVRQRRFEKMEYVVKRVLTDFEQDPGLFAELLDNFTGFLTEEGAEIGDQELPAADDQAEAETPDRLVFETIEAYLEGAEVPEVLRVFLRDIWREVLQHALDHDGYDSEGWRRRQQALADLMWSIEPKTAADERRRMVMLLPRLLDELRDGMIQLGRSPAEMDAVLDALEPIHMACLRGEPPPLEKPPANGVASPSTTHTSSSEVADMIRSIQAGISGGDEAMLAEAAMADAITGPVENAEQVAPAQDDEFTALATDMKLGTWLEFDFDEKKRRAKLAWKSAVMGEYVFVDRKYKVVAERSLVALAADLRQGHATLVKDVAMFDRALDKVLTGLMSGSKSAH